MIRIALTAGAAFLDKDGKESVKKMLDLVKNLDDQSGAELDQEADELLTALAQKDYEYLADFCQRWNITADSLPGYLIARLAEPIRVELGYDVYLPQNLDGKVIEE